MLFALKTHRCSFLQLRRRSHFQRLLGSRYSSYAEMGAHIAQSDLLHYLRRRAGHAQDPLQPPASKLHACCFLSVSVLSATSHS